MVRELERSQQQKQEFPSKATVAHPVFYRTYSRRQGNTRETWKQVCDRTINGLIKLGKLSDEEATLVRQKLENFQSLPAGRWLWVGGTEWLEQPENYHGAYNCTSTNVVDWKAFGLMMDLAMQGCGTGAVLEPQYINQLPPIRNELQVTIAGELGTTPASQRREKTEVQIQGNNVTIYVGDSRDGWVKSYQSLLEIASDERFSNRVEVTVDVSDIRPAGEPLKGFGGVANPVRLPDLYTRCAAILNKAVGRQLNELECCLLIDEAAVVVVAGNVRRSAGIRQFPADSNLYKMNLWQQGEDGNWRIDPQRDALRMANHTRVYHGKPSREECIDAVRKQFYSGEGAIQYAPEAIARSNADILDRPEIKREFLEIYNSLGVKEAKNWLRTNYPQMSDREIEHRLQRYGLNPCGIL
jgi:ribonucleotide reductase class II